MCAQHMRTILLSALILHACDLTNSYDIVDRHPKNIINQDSNVSWKCGMSVRP
jgi:hypothetical protein